MSKPLIDLPSSISADGWADDLFKAAGTRPDPTVKAPPPPPMAGPSTSSSSTIHASRTPVKENKPTLAEPRPSVTNGHGQSTSEYTAQTMPAGGLAATLSYPGHSSFPASDEDGRLKRSASHSHLSPLDLPSPLSHPGLTSAHSRTEDNLLRSPASPRAANARSPLHAQHMRNGSDTSENGTRKPGGHAPSLRSSVASKGSWRAGFTGKLKGALRLGKRERTMSEYSIRE
ncbi:hypothetical protein PENSPDRAFT_759713 [Peniophora sp. CONT]|nr:hypothetical protein PENSPDRAFT_759713 [Peniophora sp. CONT]